jgi:tRNA 5-methylaminomethyl-2-thiouridine biosynthesis bifunctional protein
MLNQNINDEVTYDTIIIGAGIAGCSVAYFLQAQGETLLVVDRSSMVASGGSGAAGAFVSPKIGKGSPLQRLTNEAYNFAKEFYANNFSEYFHQTGVIRIPKNAEDAEKFAEYGSHNDTEYQKITQVQLDLMGINGYDSFLFDEAGVCDASKLCEALLSNISYIQYDVKNIEFIDELWHVGEYKSKNIVLATGHEDHLFDMRYMGIKGTWGSRGDYRSALKLDISMHKNISISANIDGVIKIGATHVKSNEPCLLCKGEPLGELFIKASSMINTDDFELLETYCGMRSGSKDYFPLVGELIDVAEMFKTYPKITSGAKVSKPFKKINNLYVCNGLGGRGFVFGPLMGKILADCIVNKKEVDPRVNPDRLFLKWCRKSKELQR